MRGGCVIASGSESIIGGNGGGGGAGKALVPDYATSEDVANPARNNARNNNSTKSKAKTSTNTKAKAKTSAKTKTNGSSSKGAGSGPKVLFYLTARRLAVC